MGPIWGRQDPDGPHVGPMNFVFWDVIPLTTDNIASAKYNDTKPYEYLGDILD